MKLKNFFSELLDEMIPVYSGRKSVIARVLFWSGMIFFILTFIRPFGISDNHLYFLVFSNIGFSMIVALVAGVNYGFVRKYLSGRNDNRWQILQELYNLGAMVLVIASCSFFYSSLLLSHVTFSVSGVFQNFYYTLILSVPLITTDILLVLFTQYQKHVLTLETKNQYFKDINALHSLTVEKKETIALSIENEIVSFDRNGLLAISSWGNYLRFQIAVSSRIIEVVKRTTLKELEVQLQAYPEFFRCHRSHIINLSRIERFAGTIKKATVFLASGALKIPVARSCTVQVREWISTGKKLI